MKKSKKKKEKVVKGTPTAVLISILIHIGLFLLAGMFVVFTVVKQKEVEFEPPKPVERPKMKLKKPKVKIKKSSKPKPTTRIVTKVQKASMPDIQLPEMSGMGEGLGAGIGGFDLMPDLGEVSVFGSGQTVGNDLVGTFYDFKQDRTGRPVPMDRDMYKDLLMRFARDGWKASDLARYYQSPKKLYATTIMVPTVLSSLAPKAFDEPDIGGWCWAVLYKGQLVYKDDITFRFWGNGDDIMLIRVNGKMVLNACWHNSRGTGAYGTHFVDLWQSSSPDSWRYYMGNNTATVGDWITLKAGEPQEIEILIGEEPGGGFCAMLAVQVQGVEYPKNRQGGPILPAFKTAEPSHDLLDAIYKDLVPDEVSLTNGPVFCDYDTGMRPATNTAPPAAAEPPAPATEEGSGRDGGMRNWTIGGKSLEAGFVTVIGRDAVLRDARGKQRKVPLDKLSAADREFVELAQPPTFNIDFGKKTSQWKLPVSPFNSQVPPTMFDYVFSAKLRQTSAGAYNHELKVEFFAIGEEYDGDKYILLDRGEGTFVPTKENKRSYKLSGKKVEMYTREMDGVIRGTKYYGYLVVVTDERGKIIQHKASNEWLYEHLDSLKKMQVGRYMDKTCTRTFPTSPKATRY